MSDTLHADLQTFLLSKAAITSIVGANGVYWGHAPQGTAYPYISLQLTTTDRQTFRSFDGDGLKVAYIQVDCLHSGSDDVYELAEAVRGALSNYRGAMGSTTVQKCEVNDTRDEYAPPEYGTDQTIDYAIIEIEIWMQESIPN